MPTEAIGRNPVRWLFSTYEMVQRTKYQRSMARISEMELATLRALAQFHGKKKRRLPPLPTYEQSVAVEEQVVTSVESEKPAWMSKYEEVNKARRIAEEKDGKYSSGTDE